MFSPNYVITVRPIRVCCLCVVKLRHFFKIIAEMPLASVDPFILYDKQSEKCFIVKGQPVVVYVTTAALT